MVKVTGPLMSFDASGTIGKSATFSKWKGRNYARLRVIPKNPQFSTMQDVRTKLGCIGRSMSIVLRPIPPALGSEFYVAALAAAPAGQSWVSYSVRTILGSGMSTFDDNHDAFALVAETPKGYYEDASADAGLTTFSLAVVGTLTEVTGGEQLYHLLAFAVAQLGYPAPTGGLEAPTAEELADFVDFLIVASS